MEMITLICQQCGGNFCRRLSEYKRCAAKGFAVACSRRCGAILRNYKCAKGNPQNLRLGSSRDEYSPFRYFMNKAHNRTIYGPTDLDLSYLKALWESQKGICPYTHLQMSLLASTNEYQSGQSIPTQASLDRINCSLGYVKGNVEFVCLAVNYAKNGFTKNQMIEFFKGVSV